MSPGNALRISHSLHCTSVPCACRALPSAILGGRRWDPHPAGGRLLHPQTAGLSPIPSPYCRSVSSFFPATGGREMKATDQERTLLVTSSCCHGRDFRVLFKRLSVSRTWPSQCFSLKLADGHAQAQPQAPGLGHLLRDQPLCSGQALGSGERASAPRRPVGRRAPVCDIDPAYLLAESNMNHAHG